MTGDGAPAETGGGLLAEVGRVYRESRKQHDIFWNVWVARPLAAVLLVLLRRTPLTPNQVTFLGLFVFVAAVATLVGLPGPAGLIAAAVVLELSYVLDCADGQLARYKGMTSKVGAYLDFLVDEVKAILLVAGCATRLWADGGDDRWLLVGLAGVLLVSTATTLTTFVRRPEYAGEERLPGVHEAQARPGGLVGWAMWAVTSTLRWVAHYPSWFLYVALIGAHPRVPVDGAVLFLAPYLGAYALYVARTGLGVILRLGRPGFYRSAP